mmetsp:Transcript_20654/g.42339  ORF Transcript_20654/g.42339 Transcript_20654/m.42339 type:complete len:300 (-) Transcript_20654:147-1046(-)
MRLEESAWRHSCVSGSTKGKGPRSTSWALRTTAPATAFRWPCWTSPRPSSRPWPWRATPKSRKSRASSALKSKAAAVKARSCPSSARPRATASGWVSKDSRGKTTRALPRAGLSAAAAAAAAGTISRTGPGMWTSLVLGSLAEATTARTKARKEQGLSASSSASSSACSFGPKPVLCPNDLIDDYHREEEYEDRGSSSNDSANDTNDNTEAGKAPQLRNNQRQLTGSSSYSSRCSDKSNGGVLVAPTKAVVLPSAQHCCGCHRSRHYSGRRCSHRSSNDKSRGNCCRQHYHRCFMYRAL